MEAPLGQTAEAASSTLFLYESVGLAGQWVDVPGLVNIVLFRLCVQGSHSSFHQNTQSKD